jgi:putative ATPase
MPPAEAARGCRSRKIARKEEKVQNLFEGHAPERPLADRLRPERLEDVVGQDHVLGPEGPIGRMVANRRLASLILWGPPGCGKTTIARLLAGLSDLEFVPLSAVFSGVVELRKIFDGARTRRGDGRGTLLFVDEIHRFNRAQQDAFLPVVEDGTITLVGATTENPSFELNGALLSRCQVLVLHRLGDADLEVLLERAEALEEHTLPTDKDARAALRAMADGDGRFVINLAEELFSLREEKPLDTEALMRVVQRRRPLYDKSQESHYNLISALHKSLRGSDADAALYWLARMLDGGEDPRYIARRLVRFAVEDIGLADPQAVTQSLAGWESYERLGSPEGELAIAQVVVYLATAPKSNAAYKAFGKVMARAKETGSLAPPKHILNAPTRLMKDIGYGEGYLYDHETDEAFSGQHYFPDGMTREVYYEPRERGFEREIAKRLEYWNRLRAEKTSPPEDEPPSGRTDRGKKDEP